MMYSFNYKRGTQVFDNVKSLADAINFELPRNWDCRNEMPDMLIASGTTS